MPKETKGERTSPTCWKLSIVPLVAVLLVLGAVPGQCANSISLSTSAISVTGSNPNYSVNVGTIDALGFVTPGSNVSATTVGGGRLYYFQIGLSLGFNGSGTLSIKVGTNYSHSTVQTAYFCPGGSCNSVTPTATSTSYTTWATGLSGGNYTANLGTQLMPTNGSGAFTGADSVTVTLQASSSGGPATCNLTINLNVQNDVQLTLATSGGGLAITAASDFSATLGNVNGLGVGTPSSGLTAYAVSGGAVYETPINLLPVFSSFTTTTCTLSVYVSSNFAHTSLLGMRDAATSGGPYTTVSLTSATPTTMTTTAASNSTVTRYLGVFVSYQNGGSAFLGADNATLTYQLTAP